MTVKAIETEYAGYKFRSRLEARWAVFFDQLGLQWRYETQGYELRMPHGKVRRYLPDFWIASWYTWAEVKGVVGEGDIALLAAAGMQLPNPEEGGIPALPGIMLLGHIPAATAVMPAFLHFMAESELLMSPTRDGHLLHCGHLRSVAGRVDDCLNIDLGSMVATPAFDVARQARFEHGETPRRPAGDSEAIAVLGAMMMSTEALEVVLHEMHPQDHIRLVHQIIHEAVLDLYGHRKPHDPVAVAEYLSARNLLADCGGGEYLQVLIAGGGDVTIARDCARAIAQTARRRRP